MIVVAIECAVAVQKLMAERNADVLEDRRMLFRIGINLGHVLIEGDDILGDGGNIAARPPSSLIWASSGSRILNARKACEKRGCRSDQLPVRKRIKS